MDEALTALHLYLTFLANVGGDPEKRNNLKTILT